MLYYIAFDFHVLTSEYRKYTYIKGLKNKSSPLIDHGKICYLGHYYQVEHIK